MKKYIYIVVLAVVLILGAQEAFKYVTIEKTGASAHVEWGTVRAACNASNGIDVSWTTVNEDDTLNFVIERGTTVGGPFNELAGYVAARGSGSAYIHSDGAPIAGVLNWYRVVEITEQGRGSISPAVTTSALCRSVGRAPGRTPTSGGQVETP